MIVIDSVDQIISKIDTMIRKDPSDSGSFMLSDSCLLYLSEKQSLAYIEAMGNPTYNSGFHVPLVQIIENNTELITAKILQHGSEIDFIDLGPGFPDKSMPILRSLRPLRKVNYIPVDINKNFLSLAAKAVEPLVTSCTPVQALFNSYAEHRKIYTNQAANFVMLGLTFMNLEQNSFIEIVRKICCNNTTLLVAAEVNLGSVHQKKLHNRYLTPEAASFVAGPLNLANISYIQHSYFVRQRQNRIEMGFVTDIDQMVGETFVPRGCSIVTALSIRYTIGEMKTLLEELFSDVRLIFTPDGQTVMAVCSDPHQLEEK